MKFLIGERQVLAMNLILPYPKLGLTKICRSLPCLEQGLVVVVMDWRCATLPDIRVSESR